MAISISSRNVNDCVDRSSYRILIFELDENSFNKNLHEWIKDLSEKFKYVSCIKIHWNQFSKYYHFQKKCCDVNDLLVIGCKKILDFVSRPCYSDLYNIFSELNDINKLPKEERYKIPSKTPSNKYFFFTKPYECHFVQNFRYETVNSDENLSNIVKEKQNNVSTSIISQRIQSSVSNRDDSKIFNSSILKCQTQSMKTQTTILPSSIINDYIEPSNSIIRPKNPFIFPNRDQKSSSLQIKWFQESYSEIKQSVEAGNKPLSIKRKRSWSGHMSESSNSSDSFSNLSHSSKLRHASISIYSSLSKRKRHKKLNILSHQKFKWPYEGYG